MLLNFNFHENLINSEASNKTETINSNGKSPRPKKHEIAFHLFSEKIQIPEIKGNIYRKRLTELLDNFSQRFGTTLINGRAGTGKTTLAIDFATKYQNVAWFGITSTDSEWKVFSRYFLSSLNGRFPKFKDFDYGNLVNNSTPESIQKFVEFTFLELEKYCFDKSLLIVLDDLHNVFDTDWFEVFFKEIIAFNSRKVSTLFLSRTQPPFPIWRLRSKQKLGFLDEKLLLFTKSELRELIKLNGIEKETADEIYKKSFGRISKVLELADLLDFHSPQKKVPKKSKR